MVDFPAGKMRAAYVPFFALAGRRKDKGALACPSQYSYFAHASLPAEICSTDLFWICGFATVKSRLAFQEQDSDALLGLRQWLIRRGPVEGGHGNIVQAQIDAKLGAMVNHMAQERAAQHVAPRQREDRLAVEEQGPGLGQVFIRSTGNGHPRRVAILVERLDHFLPRRELGRPGGR